MTGFLCRAIFRVCAEILIFGEIFTSALVKGGPHEESALFHLVGTADGVPLVGVAADGVPPSPVTIFLSLAKCLQ